MKLSSGYPFSLIRYGLPFSYPKLEKNITTDVLVLGGGISGALAAHYLVKEGINCVLIDARTIGLGSTCASTALLQYEIDVSLHQLIQMIGKSAAVRSYKLCEAAIYAFEAENEARMAAMSAARSNIAEKLEELRARERQLRQEEITTEIVELAAGAEALKGS